VCRRLATARLRSGPAIGERADSPTAVETRAGLGRSALFSELVKLRLSLTTTRIACRRCVATLLRLMAVLSDGCCLRG